MQQVQHCMSGHCLNGNMITFRKKHKQINSDELCQCKLVRKHVQTGLVVLVFGFHKGNTPRLQQCFASAQIRKYIDLLTLAIGGNGCNDTDALEKQ